MRDPGYRPRQLDRLLEDLLRELPAVMLTGPRAAGKTTTARRLATEVVRLDRAAEAAAFRADPDAALAGQQEPLLLDEWQEVPTVLGAIKRAIDIDPRPGRFLLTGSVRADLDATSWPGTGRIIRISMYGMTVREQLGSPGRRTFLDRLASDELPVLPLQRFNLRDYVRLALTSGFPEPAIHMGPRARVRWLDGYLEQLLTRDAVGIDSGRDPLRLRRYFEALALNTAGAVADTTLLEAAGIDRKTAAAHERLLESLFVVDSIPAWTSNRLKRLALRPKRYLVDPALALAALRLDERAALRDGDVLGRLLDTFVASQLRAELPVCETRPRLYHMREQHGRHEIDIVAELGGGDLLAFEIKADAAPDRESARHLTWLRDRIGDRFLRGVVLHTGPGLYELDTRILAVPICALWGDAITEP